MSSTRNKKTTTIRGFDRRAVVAYIQELPQLELEDLYEIVTTEYSERLDTINLNEIFPDK